VYICIKKYRHICTCRITDGTAGRTDGQTAGRTDRRLNGPTGGQTGGQTDGRADRVVGARQGGPTDGRPGGRTNGLADGQPDVRTNGRADGRTDGRAGGQVNGRTGGCTARRANRRTGWQDKEHMTRLLTSTACREEVAEVCAAAYSVMQPPGRAARTDADQVRIVRLAAKTRMTDKSKQKLTHIEKPIHV
jgi:hypothetical protein